LTIEIIGFLARVDAAGLAGHSAVEPRGTRKATTVARTAVLLAAATVMLVVMPRKTGTVPIGSMTTQRVIKSVK
jgi:hypothetical protein